MKRSRIIPTLTGVALLVALAVWRFGVNQPDTAKRSARVQPADQPVEQGTSPESAAAAPVPNLGPVAAPDLPTSQLLRSIVTAIEGVQSTSDALKKDERLQHTAKEVAATDLPAVIDFLWHKQHLSGAGEELRDRLLQRWAESDPRAAADWVGQQPASSIQANAIDRIASAWANLSFDDAVAWAKQLPGDGEQHEPLARIAYEAARNSPLEAMKLAVELPAGASRDDLLAHVAGTWAATEPQLAADWVRQIEDATLRGRLVASVATIWGGENPTAAADLALTSLPPGRQQDDTVVSIVQGWAQQEPAQAAAWVMEFPDGALRQAALENLVQIWADQSLDQVGTWLRGLAVGPVRDSAAGALVAKLLPTSPSAASELAAGISDPVRRQQELEYVGRAWLESDASTARVWIAQAPLSATSRSQLLAANSEVQSPENPH